MAEKSAVEMAKELGLNPERYKNVSENVLNALQKAHNFKSAAAKKVKK